MDSLQFSASHFRPRLARFNDVTTGTIAMPCTKGSADCTTNVSTDTKGVLTVSHECGLTILQRGLAPVNVANLVITGARACRLNAKQQRLWTLK